MHTPADIETRASAPGNSTAPESLDLAEAVALMDDAASSEASDDEDGGPSEPSQDDGEGDFTSPEDLPSEADAAETSEGGESDAPGFWSAEDKAAWSAVPVELRPILKKYEQQRVEFVNEKAREAAALRARAAEEVQRANTTVDQAAAWWQQAGPALQRAFADKWSQVNWGELAEKNPQEWARLNQMRLDEAALLAEANRRGQADVQAANARAQQAHQQFKLAEHSKLADKLPDYFGTAEATRRTYDELGKFLFAKGIPADRINAIHEASIIELALSAMRFEQAQKLALRGSTGAKEGQTPARPTPTRVAPGPGSPSSGRAGNRNADAVRQVGERFRRSGGASIADAAELIRLSGL
jgi:hypothetical protein